jgi:hypothetical protein
MAVVATVIALSVQTAVAPIASAAPCTSRGAELPAGGALLPNQCLMSSSGRYGVKMHTNGSLALWDFQAPRLCWQSSQEWAPVANDRMYFKVYSIGSGYVRQVVSLSQSVNGTGHYVVGYDDYKGPTQQRSYSASINNSGQFWVGYDLHRRC